MVRSKLLVKWTKHTEKMDAFNYYLLKEQEGCLDTRADADAGSLDKKSRVGFNRINLETPLWIIGRRADEKKAKRLT